MKNMVLGVIATAMMVSFVYADEYTLQGDSVYYGNSKIADLEYSYGWKVLCAKGRNYGTVRLLNGDKKHAAQVAISECKK